MKFNIVLLVAIGLLSATHAFAQSSASCGISGEIIEVHESKSKPGEIEDIPLECRKDREENWFGAPPEAGMSKEDICKSTMAPFDIDTNARMVGMKNMSACFCMVDKQFASGIMTKCWTYFDRDHK